jgi:hypothetical protein
MRHKRRHSYPEEPRRRRRRLRLTRVIALGAIVSVLSAGIALADNVVNDVGGGGNATITAGGSVTVNYWIVANNGDGQTGCNAGDGSAATVTFNAPAGVTATPGSRTFTVCGTGAQQSVVFSSNTPGDYVITPSVSDSGTGTYNHDPGKFTLKVLAPADSTPPVITPNISGTLGNNGWYVDDVTVSWSVVDDGSAISSSSGCGPTTIIADTAGTQLTCTATSSGGTSSESVTIKRDATKPTLSPSVSPNPVLLNGSATASAGASDNLSGIASASCGPVDTSSVGSKSVTCNATDNAGNTANASANYSVGYKFVGFSSPVDNNGMLNVAKAGQAIPLKWRLLDANDVPVTNLSSVTVTVVSLSCTASTTIDEVEEYAAGSSGLQNLGDGYYQFNWKTPTNYANSCKTMNLNLGEGSNRTALFQFKK